MALKGTDSKQKIMKVLTDVFKGTFISDKNLIIPFNENGEQVQVKVSLTAVKNLIDTGSQDLNEVGEYTEQEKITVDSLIKALGLENVTL